MFQKLLMASVLGLFFILNVCYGSNTLLYGVAGKTSSISLREFQKNEIQTIKSALGESVNVKIFSNHNDELNEIQKKSNTLTFVYAKEFITPELSKLNNWEKVTQLFFMDPVTNHFSKSYSSYLFTSKNSNITKLSDLSNKKLVYYSAESNSNYIAIKKLFSNNKVSNVQWIKAKNINQAYEMVKSGKADAVGTWHYTYFSDKQKSNFKVIYKIEHLNNPALYVNRNILSSQEIKTVKIALQKIGSNTSANYIYK